LSGAAGFTGTESAREAFSYRPPWEEVPVTIEQILADCVREELQARLTGMWF
jgi:hypothetical protein